MTPLRAVILAVLLAPLTLAQAPQREVAFTVDDLPFMTYGAQSMDAAAAQTRKMIAAFKTHGIPAIGFVNGRSVAGDARRIALLRQWVDAGLELGNHSFSHLDLHATPLETYQQDIVRGEAATMNLVGKRPRYFRHPQLHTGRSLEVKRGLERFLADRGYRIAPVTIDNYDYMFAKAYALASGDDRAGIAKAYLEYMTAVVAFYEQQSTAILGREVRQTLLLHASALNADSMDALATMFKSRGYAFITLDRALEDPA